MYHTQVANKVLTIAADDHKLGLPKLLVVGNLVVVSLTFTKLKDTTSAIKADLEVLDLLGVNCLKVKMELVGGRLDGD